MEAKIHRKERIGDATLGELWIEDTTFRAHCLEDVERLVKVKGKTAIPCGRYPMRLSLSPRFRRITLEIYDVPNYVGVRIHAGNTADNTEGCPLVAWSREKGKITKSKSCEVALTALAQQFKENEEMWITITSDCKPIDAVENTQKT